MIDVNVNVMNAKPNMLMKLGYFISYIGLLYKMGGFKNIYQYIKGKILLYVFKWRYRHCKKFRVKLQTNAKKQGMLYVAMLESFMKKTPIDFKSIYGSLTEEQKKKFKEAKDKNVSKVIEEYNITDERQIAELKEYANSMLSGKDYLQAVLNQSTSDNK